MATLLSAGIPFIADSGKRPNQLRRRIANLLATNHTLSLKKLHTALGKVYRGEWGIPSLLILREFCNQSPECRIIGNNVVVTDFLQGQTASGKFSVKTLLDRNAKVFALMSACLGDL